MYFDTLSSSAHLDVNVVPASSNESFFCYDDQEVARCRSASLGSTTYLPLVIGNITLAGILEQNLVMERETGWYRNQRIANYDCFSCPRTGRWLIFVVVAWGLSWPLPGYSCSERRRQSFSPTFRGVGDRIIEFDRCNLQYCRHVEHVYAFYFVTTLFSNKVRNNILSPFCSINITFILVLKGFLHKIGFISCTCKNSSAMNRFGKPPSIPNHYQLRERSSC